MIISSRKVRKYFQENHSFAGFAFSAGGKNSFGISPSLALAKLKPTKQDGIMRRNYDAAKTAY
jgi:hypothetical protein